MCANVYMSLKLGRAYRVLLAECLIIFQSTHSIFFVVHLKYPNVLFKQHFKREIPPFVFFYRQLVKS